MTSSSKDKPPVDHPPQGWPRELSLQESPQHLWVATSFIWLSNTCRKHCKSHKCPGIIQLCEWKKIFVCHLREFEEAMAIQP